MRVHLFAYGTLEIPEVVQIITGQRLRGVPARLEGHARYLLREQAYPGLVREDGARVSGTLYMDLDEVIMARIDEYEDTCYERRTLQVATENGMSFPAQAYVVPENARDLLSDRLWDRERFIREELDSFLRCLVG